MEEVVISITKKEVETKLIDSLLALLPNEEFVLRKKDKRIVHKTKIGFESVGFRLINYWPYCIEIDGVGISIRFNAVEEIINPIKVKNGLNASMEFSKTSVTIGNYQEFKVKVFNEKDVSNFIFAYINKIKKNCVSFFSKYQDIEDVNVYYKNIISNNADTINPIMTSLTLIRLCKDKDFDEKKIKYRQILQPLDGMEEHTFSAYDDLVEYLSRL